MASTLKWSFLGIILCLVIVNLLNKGLPDSLDAMKDSETQSSKPFSAAENKSAKYKVERKKRNEDEVMHNRMKKSHIKSRLSKGTNQPIGIMMTKKMKITMCSVDGNSELG